METRDQWYKPNLLYNIHWRPPKKQEAPDMIVKTIRFNPSVCTCGEHSCGPHYRMERRVVWMKKEIANRENKEVKSDLRCLPRDRVNKAKESEGLRSKEENIGDANCENERVGQNRCVKGESDHIEIIKEGFHGGDGTRSEKDDNREGGKNKDSSESEGFKGLKDEIVVGKNVWCAKDKEDSADGCKAGNIDANVGVKRNGERKDCNDGGGLIVKEHRRNGENILDDNYDDNPGADEYRKYGDDEYLIRTPGSLNSKSDEENDCKNFKERVKNDDEDSASFNGENKRTGHKLVLLDKSDSENVGEDLSSDCNFSVEDAGKLRHDHRIDGSTDYGERCNVLSTDYSEDGCDIDVTGEIYQDEEISPAFGIMWIYCSSELHYNVLSPSA